MPYIDIDIDDFLSSCNRREIENVISWLEQKGHIPSEKSRIEEINIYDGRTYRQSKFIDSIYGLGKNYDAISNEETDIIIDIAKKYCPL